MHVIQKKILDALRNKTFTMVSLRQLGQELDVQHPQLVKHHLLQLEKKGLLTIRKHDNNCLSASLATTTNQSMLTAIPILGAANCGPATLFADDHIEGYLKLSKGMITPTDAGSFFAIQAVGNSMNKASIRGNTIEDGDYVIVDSRKTAPVDNDYVVAVIDDMANIKKYYFDTAHYQICLLSESTNTLPPIFIHPSDDFQISGTVVQVIKKPNQ